MLRNLQFLVNEVMDIINRETGIVDKFGRVIACSNTQNIDKLVLDFDDIKNSTKDEVFLNNFLYKKLFDTKNKLGFVTYISGENSQSNQNILSLFSMNVLNVKKIYDEKYSKYNFFKDIFFENILSNDIPLCYGNIATNKDMDKVVFVIKTQIKSSKLLYESIVQLSQQIQNIYIVLIDDETCVIVKEFEIDNNSGDALTHANQFANNLLEKIKLKKDLNINIHIGIGSVIRNIEELESSFEDAKMALVVGEVFCENKRIHHYKNLGIGRLMYHLPKSICKIFLEENFQNKNCDIFDIETISTFEKLCEYNFNISEASKALFIHRNTLMYRIEKIKQNTNLDIRNFEDAVTFKISIMAKKHLEKLEKNKFQHIDKNL